jgi:hypothetical protein
MEEQIYLTWNVTNWVTVVLMVLISWWVLTGIARVLGITSKDEEVKS